MSKRSIATIGGVVAATLLIAGIAWASGLDDAPASTTPSTSTSLDDNGSSTSSDDNSTSTSLDGVTSTTVDDNTSTSSANTSTSTTIDDNTSSTIDDEDDDADDRDHGDDENEDQDDNSGKGGGDDNAAAVADGLHTFDVAGVGDVTVNVVSGTLQLIDVQASSGWTIEVDKAQVDRIKIKFRNGESEAEFEAELEHGGIKVEVEAGS